MSNTMNDLMTLADIADLNRMSEKDADGVRVLDGGQK